MVVREGRLGLSDRDLLSRVDLGRLGRCLRLPWAGGRQLCPLSLGLLCGCNLVGTRFTAESIQKWMLGLTETLHSGRTFDLGWLPRLTETSFPVPLWEVVLGRLCHLLPRFSCSPHLLPHDIPQAECEETIRGLE